MSFFPQPIHLCTVREKGYRGRETGRIEKHKKFSRHERLKTRYNEGPRTGNNRQYTLGLRGMRNEVQVAKNRKREMRNMERVRKEEECGTSDEV